MHSNSFIEISKSYFGKPDREFIETRNEKVKKYWKEIRRGDAEFPEKHQCQIDPKQRLYPGFQADVIWEGLGIVDYKQYAKPGIKLSEYTQEQIKSGLVKWIAVWKWFNNNKHEELEEGKSVGYEILGLVDAQSALEMINSEGRFSYEFFSKK